MYVRCFPPLFCDAFSPGVIASRHYPLSGERGVDYDDDDAADDDYGGVAWQGANRAFFAQPPPPPHTLPDFVVLSIWMSFASFSFAAAAAVLSVTRSVGVGKYSENGRR